MTTDIKAALTDIAETNCNIIGLTCAAAVEHIEQLEARLSTQTAGPEICTGCNGRGEVGGLTMEGYQSEPCPYCKIEQPGLSACKCSLRTKLVGDGCAVCNPKLAEELSGQSGMDAA